MKVESYRVWQLKKEAYNLIDSEDWIELDKVLTEIIKLTTTEEA